MIETAMLCHASIAPSTRQAPYAGSKKGKKKKSKANRGQASQQHQQPGGSPNNSTEKIVNGNGGTGAQAARITGNIKRMKKLVAVFREIERNSSPQGDDANGENSASTGDTFAPARRTAFRRKKGSKQEPVGEDLTAHDGPIDVKPDRHKRPLLIVDGYNICHFWSKTKPMMECGDIQSARALLLSSLELHSTLRNLQVTVVFDYFGKNDKPEAYVEKRHTDLEIVFAGNFRSDAIDADNWIERKVAEIKRKDEGAVVWIATRDRALSSMTFGYGGLTISPEKLMQQFEENQKRRAEQIDQLNARSNSRAVKLEKQIDPQVVALLNDLALRARKQ